MIRLAIDSIIVSKNVPFKYHLFSIYFQQFRVLLAVTDVLIMNRRKFSFILDGSMYEVNWRINDSFESMNYQYVIRSLETGYGFDKFSSGTRRIYDSIHRSRTFDSTGFIKSLVNNGIHRTFQKLCVINHPTICHRCRKILLVSCSSIRDFLLANRHSIIPLEKPSKFSKYPLLRTSQLCSQLCFNIRKKWKILS